ncbi:MAG TPA: polysulfide reductase NrfD [Beijerinckiaceae bacterium]|nr:polysulfide reductase NrfD [Beijerinckiaceae bacterium]
MAHVGYREASAGPGFWAAVFGLGVLVLAGLGSAWYMEHHGHIVTGMTNRIVWGMPHVFAIFLIVGASGVLNVASLASVFGKMPYKPKARLSGLLAIAMLMSGLIVLVLDLGRPDRLTVAMTSYNFRSIFAWNIFLYTGFLVIVGAYLVVQMTRRWQGWTGAVGVTAFLWRLILTTGTGSIFGWLVAREAYNAAVMAPLFIAMSLNIGLAVFILVRMSVAAGETHDLTDALLERMARLLGIFIAAVLYFTAVQHLTNLYSASRIGVERFLLVDGGIYPMLFWGVQIVLGSLVPLAIVFSPRTARSHPMIALAAVLVMIGGLAQLYVIIIGGQAYPLQLFPGMEVSSSYHDGVVARYVPSLPEFGLGLGGLALSFLITFIGVRVLKILPVNVGASAGA